MRESCPMLSCVVIVTVIQMTVSTVQQGIKLVLIYIHYYGYTFV